MKVWVHAFYADGSQMLGNGDGQGPITTPSGRYKRTAHYERVRAGKVSKRPAFYIIVDDNGKLLEVFDNPSHVTSRGNP